MLIFCHLATYDEKAGTFRHHSPYFGDWSEQAGLCFAADWANQDLANLTRKQPRLNDGEYGDMSLGKHTTISWAASPTNWAMRSGCLIAANAGMSDACMKSK